MSTMGQREKSPTRVASGRRSGTTTARTVTSRTVSPALAPSTGPVPMPGTWLESLPVEPGQALVGYPAPAVVDGQGVAAVGELGELGDGRGVTVLLQGGLGDRPGNRVILAARDQQQRSAIL